MNLLDANLLLYAHNNAAPQQQAAAAWLELLLSGPQPVGLPWHSILAFLRLSTNPAAYPNPLTIQEAITIMAEYLAIEGVVIVEPGPWHWEILSKVLVEGQARAAQVSDGHLAALAIEHGATLCTTDRGFARFPGVRFVNPLA